MLEFQNSNGGFTTAANASSSKIVELSKKLREKNSEVEVLKTKCSKLEKLLREVEDNQQKQDTNGQLSSSFLLLYQYFHCTVPEKEDKEEAAEKQDKIKTLQEKLSSTSIRLFETKNQNMQLKNDLKLATKLLQQEVGESFESVQSMLNTNSNWRGRAQMVCDLQQKICELKEKLKTSQESGIALKERNNIF